MSVSQPAAPDLGTPEPDEHPVAGRPATEPERVRRVTVGDWWLPAAAAVLAVALFLLVKNSLTDDGYITLDYAKNLAVHGKWGMVDGSTANSATSPLNVLLLGFLTLLTRVVGSPHPVIALGVLNVVASATIGWGWTRLMRAFNLPAAAAVVGLVLVLVNPFVLSATGLEVLLIPAVLMLLTVFAVEGRPALFGVAVGLTVITRLDLIVFVVLIALSAAPIRRKLLRVVAFAILVAGPWYLFSWFALGSFVPDTLVIKQAQGGLFGQWDYFSGPMMYYTGRSLVVLVTFAPAIIGVAALLGWLATRFTARGREFPPVGPLVALGLGGVAYYVIYSYLGVGPYHWYYVTPMVSAGMFVVALFGVWLAQSRKRQPRAKASAPALAVGLVGVIALSNVAVDIKQGVPWPSPVIFGNWASAQEYARVAKQIGQRLNGASVASPGEIGTLAYYCDCTILDEFSDRGQVTSLVQKQIDEAGTVMKLAYRVNYHWFDRGLRPRKTDYRLLYDRGPAKGPDSWQVYSAAKGIGHFTLVRQN
ncbi:hypothetical protein [Amycolatopsis sp. H20-H5]|uniref:hypothetical protein n=1 Tax=Amycolatopsis sp. H20-H5 TaxID=3046309 RepID=UPI002DBD33C2|nr:hypothetical protein [Amycolatopsis sp. H20-H5]MEC3980291.1 hypothetical protein [Amycolatopsis sp. H20-H5]